MVLDVKDRGNYLVIEAKDELLIIRKNEIKAVEFYIEDDEKNLRFFIHGNTICIPIDNEKDRNISNTLIKILSFIKENGNE